MALTPSRKGAVACAADGNAGPFAVVDDGVAAPLEKLSVAALTPFGRGAMARAANGVAGSPRRHRRAVVRRPCRRDVPLCAGEVAHCIGHAKSAWAPALATASVLPSLLKRSTDSGLKNFLVFALALLASVSAAFLAPTLTTCAALKVYVLGGGAGFPAAALDADVDGP